MLRFRVEGAQLEVVRGAAAPLRDPREPGLHAQPVPDAAGCVKRHDLGPDGGRLDGAAAIGDEDREDPGPRREKCLLPCSRARSQWRADGEGRPDCRRV